MRAVEHLLVSKFRSHIHAPYLRARVYVGISVASLSARLGVYRVIHTDTGSRHGTFNSTEMTGLIGLYLQVLKQIVAGTETVRVRNHSVAL